MRKAEIYLYDRLTGLLIEDENGYTFQYNEDYLADNPKESEILKSRTIGIAIPRKESTNFSWTSGVTVYIRSGRTRSR